MAWKSSPCGPSATPSGGPTCWGLLPARIETPGAVMSGLLTPRLCPAPPRELNDAMTSPCPVPLMPWVIVAMTLVWPEMNATRAVPCANWMWLTGRKWLSVSRSVWPALPLYRTMPAAPPWRTLKPSATRPTGLPRLHTTILSVNVPAAAGASHSALELTTIAFGPTPSVSEMPSIDIVAPPSAVRLTLFLKTRGPVLAATVVTHGPRWSVVSAPGPELPAEAATKMPAL